MGGEDPLNILKSATGLGMDPKQYQRRSRGEVQRGMEPREFISGGFKLKDMTGFDTFEEQKELSEFLQKYGAANRLGEGIVAAEIIFGAPALIRAGIKNAPKIARGFKEKVAPFIGPTIAVPAAIGAGASLVEGYDAQAASPKTGIKVGETLADKLKIGDVVPLPKGQSVIDISPEIREVVEKGKPEALVWEKVFGEGTYGTKNSGFSQSLTGAKSTDALFPTMPGAYTEAAHKAFFENAFGMSLVNRANKVLPNATKVQKNRLINTFARLENELEKNPTLVRYVNKLIKEGKIDVPYDKYKTTKQLMDEADSIAFPIKTNNRGLPLAGAKSAFQDRLGMEMAVDEAAKKFNINDPATWVGVVQATARGTKGGGAGANELILPSDPKIRDEITELIKKASELTVTRRAGAQLEQFLKPGQTMEGSLTDLANKFNIRKDEFLVGVRKIKEELNITIQVGKKLDELAAAPSDRKQEKLQQELYSLYFKGLEQRGLTNLAKEARIFNAYKKELNKILEKGPKTYYAMDHMKPIMSLFNQYYKKGDQLPFSSLKRIFEPKNLNILTTDANTIIKSGYLEDVTQGLGQAINSFNSATKPATRAAAKKTAEKAINKFKKAVREYNKRNPNDRIYYDLTDNMAYPKWARISNTGVITNPFRILANTIKREAAKNPDIKFPTISPLLLRRRAEDMKDPLTDEELKIILDFMKEQGISIRGVRGFEEGGRVDFVTGGLSESIKEVQEEIKRTTQPLRETIADVSKPYAIKAKEVLDDTAKVLNKNERPAEFRVVSDGYKLVTESPIIKSIVALPAKGQIAGLEAVEAIYNTIRPGVENDIEMEEKFPAIYGIHRLLTESVGKTPDDQTYISVVDEINRAQETGFTRLGYNIADFVASGIDGVSNRTEFTERVRDSYDKSVKEGKFTEPETFLGEVGAIAVEFGAPGGAIFKGVNAARRFLGGITGFNLFTTPTYSLKGGKWLATKISNVAKRAGTSATVFGATDIVAGGPYNTVSDAFSDDPLLFDESLGYDYEDTTNLSGKELAIANFKNRLRFGADGAIIGGLFPLVGPPLWAATKFGVIKPVTGLTKGLLRVGDELAVKPVSYLATGTLKAPLSKPGQLEVQVPLLGEAVQGVGSGVKIFADFLGKDIITRAAVTAMGAKPGLVKQLPDFKDWRMFDVNSDDPLKKNLKKIDNVFSFFREAGPRSANQLFLDTEAQNFIKGKQRQIEKLIDSIERKSYDLANGFLRRYNTSKTSPAGQQYILDQTLAYLKGQIKLTQLPPEIQEAAKALNKEFVEIRTLFRDVLPEGSGLRDFLTMNLGSYMRQSFGVFTNPQFKPDPELVEKATKFIEGRIRANESLVELAARVSNKPTDEAVTDFARKQVQDLLATAKAEGFDPLIQLQRIARENLKMDDLIIQTGEELPAVIRKLLGEEDSLRSSVLQTTSSLLTQATNLKNYERIGELLLREGRLFASRDEAIAAGVTNPLVVGRVPGLGLLESGIANLYGSREITDLLRGTGGMLDKFMQNSIYQSMIAYKAGVQTGKTVLSPATQSRNFLSAGAFVLNNGWIGGKASVTDAFKIVLDDVFGAGRTLNEVDLINNIARKSELGVIDENIVASELTAVLSDIKNGKIGTIAQLTTRADDSALMKTATSLFSGGDNVWKWYAHEYLMSQLKGAFKNVDEVKRAVLDDFNIDVFNPKNLSQAVEEYAALLVRELMPTYSKVPPVIQAIRKIPFFGNFVSFPAEILRTSVATSSLAMKHIASGNPTLRAMGLRSLAGQGLTLFALNEGAKALGHAFTNVTPEQIKTYKEEFGPAFMRFSELVPISNIDEQKGTFKVFDLSRFNPYDLVTATANNLLVRATDPQATLDPDKIETDVFKSYLNASGPLLDLVNGTLLGFSIGFEGIAEIFEGRTKQGSPIYSGSDRDIEKLDKAIAHLLKKDEPGILSTGRRILNALEQDVTGTGQVIKLQDEGFKLSGGSSVTIDVPGSFAYKISEFKNTFKEPKVAEGFYSTKDYQKRGPAQLVREYNQQNEEAFREQYRFYRATRAALDSGLMNRTQVITALKARDLSNTAIAAILSGRYVPLSYGKDALISRYNKIKSGQPNKVFNINDFVPIGGLEQVKNKWRQFKFEDFERQTREPEQLPDLPQVETPVEEKPVATKPLPTSPDPAPPLSQTADVIPATGLTTTETALLSPSDQIIRQRQRGIV